MGKLKLMNFEPKPDPAVPFKRLKQGEVFRYPDGYQPFMRISDQRTHPGRPAEARAVCLSSGDAVVLHSVEAWVVPMRCVLMKINDEELTAEEATS